MGRGSGGVGRAKTKSSKMTCNRQSATATGEISQLMEQAIGSKRSAMDCITSIIHIINYDMW